MRRELVDAQGRPYFLWDEDTRIEESRERLRDPDPAVRAYHLGKLMRQAKPNDVFTFVSLREIEEQLAAVEPYLGRSRAFWLWILERWRVIEDGNHDTLLAKDGTYARLYRMQAQGYT